MANNNNAAPPLVPENEDAYANTPRAPDPEFVGHEVAIERVVNDGPLRITFRGRAYALNMPELRGAMNVGGAAPAWCNDWRILHNHCGGAMFDCVGPPDVRCEVNPWVHRDVGAWVVDA